MPRQQQHHDDDHDMTQDEEAAVQVQYERCKVDLEAACVEAAALYDAWRSARSRAVLAEDRLQALCRHHHQRGDR